MSKKPTIVPDYADIQSIGIPRALLYYRYSVFWQHFFEGLGVRVVLSEPTDRALLATGEAHSIDECCLASKVYMGHVASLVGKCDAIFVPGISNLGDRHSFCSKFQSLPDLVNNTFHHQVRLVTCMVEVLVAQRTMEDAFSILAQRFGLSARQSKKLVVSALEAQKKYDDALAKRQHTLLKQPKEPGKPRILVLAHPYIAADEYLGAPVLDALKACGAQVFLAEHADHEACYKASQNFSVTMPWQVNRELLGALLLLRDQVDGVVLISAFPCGPDSMTNDSILRCITGIPMLNLVIDAQSATAGLQTRVESFVDILQYAGKGGYV